MELTINYYLYTNEFVEPGSESEKEAEQPKLLGSEVSNNIVQVLCPSNTDQHSVTITKFFAHESVHRWVIEKIEHPLATTTNIFLSPRDETKREVFLPKTRRSHPKVIQKIQKGTLVEVEYGFVQQVRKHDGNLRTNKRYPDMVHHGEMHKRRLALVVGIKGNLVKVVPVTSVEDQKLGDKSIFELSYDSLEELVGYNDRYKSSYAICHLMQTVSMTRILPPLSKQKNKAFPFRDTKYPHKLVLDDIKKLEGALSASVGCGDYQTVKEERNQLRIISQDTSTELNDLRNEYTHLEQEKARLTNVEERFNALMEIMIDWKLGIGSASTAEARQAIDSEIDEYIQILAGS